MRIFSGSLGCSRSHQPRCLRVEVPHCELVCRDSLLSLLRLSAVLVVGQLWAFRSALFGSCRDPLRVSHLVALSVTQFGCNVCASTCGKGRSNGCRSTCYQAAWSLPASAGWPGHAQLGAAPGMQIQEKRCMGMQIRVNVPHIVIPIRNREQMSSRMGTNEYIHGQQRLSSGICAFQISKNRQAPQTMVSSRDRQN